MTVASTHVFAFGPGTTVLVDDLSTEQVPDAVQVSVYDGHTHLVVSGELDVVQRLIVQGDTGLNRIRAARADAERNGHIAAELRELSGEHPVVPEEDR